MVLDPLRNIDFKPEKTYCTSLYWFLFLQEPLLLVLKQDWCTIHSQSLQTVGYHLILQLSILGGETCLKIRLLHNLIIDFWYDLFCFSIFWNIYLIGKKKFNIDLYSYPAGGGLGLHKVNSLSSRFLVRSNLNWN